MHYPQKVDTYTFWLLKSAMFDNTDPEVRTFDFYENFRFGPNLKFTNSKNLFWTNLENYAMENKNRKFLCSSRFTRGIQVSKL